MKKLIPAICMTLVAAAMFATSTFAWFSMNTTVTATGMQVTAKSNAIYLLIGGNSGIASNKTGLSTTVAATYATEGNDAKACYPVAYTTAATTVGGTAVAEKSWYTASNGNSNNATDAITNVRPVTEGAADYMLTYKVWLTLSADSEDAEKYIKVTFSKGDSDDAALSAVVKIGTTDTFALNSTTTNGTTANKVTLTGSTAVEVTVYVYIDGNSENVYSDYINTPHSIAGTVGLSFDLLDTLPASGS